MSTEVILSGLAAIFAALTLFFIKNKNNDTNIENLSKDIERLEKLLREELRLTREDTTNASRDLRTELNQNLKLTSDSSDKRLQSLQEGLFKQFADLAERMRQHLEKVRETVDKRLESIQQDNEKRLEQIRLTVDEKLHQTLEKRLTNSFKLVDEKLLMVQKGLGEMRTVASDVVDLKKVLTNVKTRGVMGEYQLANIIEEIFVPDQYVRNMKIKPDSNEHVEFAIKFNFSGQETTYLPIDSKFPLDAYHSLLNARETADLKLIEQKSKALTDAIRKAGQDISTKYLNPPQTTDYAVMFLPVEGLYAEIIQNTELFETLYREYKVIVAGPTTLVALLTSFNMRFRTIAISKHSDEVWQILNSVKTEFDKFGDLLEKTKNKIDEAGSNLDDLIGVRTRAIHKKLNKAQELPLQKDNLLPLNNGNEFN